MRKEPKSNIQFVCDDHAPSPDALLANEPPESFVGAFVKVAFYAVNPYTGGDTKEHLWVKVVRVAPKNSARRKKLGELEGTVGNTPLFDCYDKRERPVTFGMKVNVRCNEVEAILWPAPTQTH